MPLLTARLKQRALELGCAAVGIARAQLLTYAQQVLANAIGHGLTAHWITDPKEAERRTDPRSLLPQARSVVSVAISYPGVGTDEKPPGLRGRIARFARGRDYHLVLREVLSQLATWLAAEAGESIQCSICVDVESVAERAWAMQAGVGWQGKHGCIIVPGHGSWVVLGELITDLDLEPDEPAQDDCGDYDECMRACPTGAIVAPGVVDVRLCLSSLTQMPGFVPRELRSAMGDRIYGCDTCQEACLANRDVRPADYPESSMSTPDDAYPTLVRLLEMSSAEFEQRLAATAYGWIGHIRLRRNAAIALGNAGDPQAVPALIDALHDPAPIIRGHAAWALRKIGGTAARMALDRHCSVETNAVVIEEL